KFTHDGSEGPSASFQVKVEDGNEDSSAPVTGTFNFTVTPVNDGAATISISDTTQTASAPKVGDVLQATLGADPDGAQSNIVHHWLRDGVDTGASGATYTLVAADAGHAISVKATYADGQNFNETVNSAATAAVVSANHAPAGTNATMGLIEDKTYTFKAADFGYSDADGDAFAGVTVNAPASTSAGELMLGNVAITSATYVSAAEIASGMLTWAPADNAFGASGNAAFTFQVRDSAGNNDLTANTLTLSMSTSNYDDITYHDHDADLGVGAGYSNISIQQMDSGNQTIEFATASSTVFGDLNFVRSDNNLEITLATNGASRTVTVINQFSGGDSTWEQVDFDGGSFAGYDLGSTAYNLAKGLVGGNGNSRDIIAGSAASESMNGGNGNDLLFGNGGDDTLHGDSGDDLLVGGLGRDTLYGDQGNDTLVGDQSDILLDGGENTDTLAVGANFTSTSDTQIVDVENVILTAAVTLDLSNQAEGFKITGSSGADTIKGGGGNDTITGGNGADFLTGNSGADTFVIGSGESSASISGSGDNGVVSGYDTISDFNAASDKLSLAGTPFSAANTSGVNGNNSVLTIGGSAISSHSISNGIISFDDTGTFSSALILSGTQNVAAVVDYLQRNGLGSAGATVAFTATIAGVVHTYIYEQVGNVPNSGNDILIDLNNVSLTSAGTSLSTLIGNNAIDPIILDLDHNGVALTSLDHGVQFDINADGHKDQIAWTAGADGILALDVDGNGKIDNGSEIFSPHFAGGTYVDGLAALSTLDSNHDGKIDAADEAFSKLTVWQDLNHNGISDSGELSSLADHAISSISLDATASNSEINGQSILADGSYTLTDGSTGHFVEVAFDTTLGGSENGSNAYSLIGSDGDDILSGSGGMFTISGGAGADTFVLDADALNDVKLADVITDFKASEGDTLDVSKLLDSLLGHEASEAEALASVKTTVSGADTVVSVNANGGWHDVAVLQNTTEAVKILFDDKHDTTTAPHVG
ncbi:MAG: type I secretion C-terminal target domain-containing protein, partial [Rhizobium sp.]|uniref:beta strand repeat-containing protein n=1 Tax=Rhizobium sp. TaxID=391 RepID=UPI0030F3451C